MHRFLISAAAILVLTSCGDNSGPTSPKPTSPPQTRQLERVEWECDRRETSEGEDLHCHATAHYNAEPREVDVTADLTSGDVRTTDANVLQPDRYRADLDGRPFVVTAVGAGEAATWIQFESSMRLPRSRGRVNACGLTS